jgi:hypothetical protein
MVDRGVIILSSIPTERRAHQRIDTNIQLQGSPERGDIVARMTTNNLSLGGLQCTSSAGFPEMTRLAVRLMLPAIQSDGTEPVDLEAVVVRCEEVERSSSGDDRFSLALFFTRLDDITRERLSEFIAA